MTDKALRFSDRDIQRLKATEKTYIESEPGGLYIRVLPSGRKSFVTVYTFDGKQQWKTLGKYPDLSLAKARKKVAAIREKVADGINPALEEQQQRTERINAPTVEQFAGEYLKRWAYRQKKTAKEDERILYKDVLPAWGKTKLQDITRRDVIALLDVIAERGPIMANRSLAVIRKMFNFAVNRGALESTPCLNITPPGKEVKKDRYLSSTEISSLWPLMTEHLTDQTNRAIKMILATAQRPNEVASMRWDEINGQWWTIPASKTKNGKEHRVFLNSVALELMGEPKTTGFVFPSYRAENQAIHPNAFGKALRSQMTTFVIASMRWEEIDGSWWTIPGSKTKNGKEYRFLLNSIALEHMQEPKTTGFVFGSQSIEKQAIHRSAVSRALRSQMENFVGVEYFSAHDLRRTAATHLAELGYGLIVGKILNHTDSSVTMVYNRYQYDAEIQAAMLAWGRKLEELITGQKAGKIVQLRAS